MYFYNTIVYDSNKNSITSVLHTNCSFDVLCSVCILERIVSVII